MNNDQEHEFEIRKAEDGTYHVVRVFRAGASMVINDTLRSTVDEAEIWLKAIESAIKLTRKR